MAAKAQIPENRNFKDTNADRNHDAFLVLRWIQLERNTLSLERSSHILGNLHCRMPAV